MEGATIDDFIKTAGVARGTFYNYFQTRDELISALWKHLGDTPLRIIRKAQGYPEECAFLVLRGLGMESEQARQGSQQKLPAIRL